MDRVKMGAVLQIRLTNGLKSALYERARQMNLRPADLARAALAMVAQDGIALGEAGVQQGRGEVQAQEVYCERA